MGSIDQGSFIIDHEFIGRPLCRGSAIRPQAIFHGRRSPGQWPPCVGMGNGDLDFGIAVRSIGRQRVRGGLVSVGIGLRHWFAQRARCLADKSAMRLAIP